MTKPEPPSTGTEASAFPPAGLRRAPPLARNPCIEWSGDSQYFGTARRQPGCSSHNSSGAQAHTQLFSLTEPPLQEPNTVLIPTPEGRNLQLTSTSQPPAAVTSPKLFTSTPSPTAPLLCKTRSGLVIDHWRLDGLQQAHLKGGAKAHHGCECERRQTQGSLIPEEQHMYQRRSCIEAQNDHNNSKQGEKQKGEDRAPSFKIGTGAVFGSESLVEKTWWQVDVAAALSTL
jgi:hypothetical protein